MIVPMYKYSFLVYHKERKAFMKQLMDVGAVEVVSRGVPEDDYAQRMSSNIRDAKRVLNVAQQRLKDIKGKARENIELPRPRLNNVLELEKELEARKHDVDGYVDELKLLEPWGEFDWNEIRQLEQVGQFRMRFCHHPQNKFNKEWYDHFPIEIIKYDGGKIYFIIFQKDEDADLPVVPLALPKDSYAELERKKAACEKRIKEINYLLDYYAERYITDLEEGIVKAQDDLALHVAELHSSDLEESKMVWVEGWCPKTKRDKLQRYLDTNQIVAIEHEPEED